MLDDEKRKNVNINGRMCKTERDNTSSNDENYIDSERHANAAVLMLQESIIALLLFRDIERLRLWIFLVLDFLRSVFVRLFRAFFAQIAALAACLLPNKLESIYICLNLAIQYKLIAHSHHFAQQKTNQHTKLLEQFSMLLTI